MLLRWALAFAVLTLIAAVFGFGGMAGDFAGIARIFLFIFMILAVISLVFHSKGGSGPVV